MKQKIISIFKKIFKMTKQEAEQQLADAIAVAQRLGTENKQLKQTNSDLQAANISLTGELNSAIDRVRYLADQLKMREAQQVATRKFNDNDRNY
jgi:predicted RNase H-like nuclease (RuvC/YqgF family)